MAAYLVEHPPVRSQYRAPRRDEVSGVVVVHTAENTPDFVAFDGGAEAVARFIQGRSDPGSYHDICDSDSAINLVPYEWEAFHDATGSNPHSYGVSGATRADVWPLAPPAWRDGCIAQMAAAAARYAGWVRQRTGIVIPARRINRSESELRIPGFISHAERDPARRTDPGASFPWAQFLAEFDRLTRSTPTPVPALEDLMPFPVIATSHDQGQRPWTALLPGKIIRFANFDLGLPSAETAGARETQAPGWVFYAGYEAGVFGPLERMTIYNGQPASGDASIAAYDQACAAAAQFCGLVTA